MSMFFVMDYKVPGIDHELENNLFTFGYNVELAHGHRLTHLIAGWIWS